MIREKNIELHFEHGEFPLRAGEWLNRVERQELTRLLRGLKRFELEIGVSDIEVGHGRWTEDGKTFGNAIVKARWRDGGVFLTFEPGAGVPPPMPKGKPHN